MVPRGVCLTLLIWISLLYYHLHLLFCAKYLNKKLDRVSNFLFQTFKLSVFLFKDFYSSRATIRGIINLSKPLIYDEIVAKLLLFPLASAPFVLSATNATNFSITQYIKMANKKNK